MLDLVVTTRLGVQFQGRSLMGPDQVLERFRLLKQTSAPSLSALVDVKPSWLVQTAPEHLDLVREAFTEELPNLMSRLPVHVVSREQDGATPAELTVELDLPSRFLCLRLDSDDHYLREPLMQALARFENRPVGTLIDFPRGFLCDLDSGRARRKSYSVQGPFFGVITTPDDPMAANGHHGRARLGRDCVEQLSRAWVQTVHGNNAFTVFGGADRRAELRSMLKQMRRARRSRSYSQILGRPLDLVPLSAQKQKLLHGVIEPPFEHSY